MHSDADFLAAVAANPTDQLTRLVHVDWLDERADPRGELVRIEEEVRFEPAWSEVLWRQKPRRNELRAACDPAWLAAMRYGTACLTLFYGRPFPDHWRDGWRLIREATERWLGVPMPDVGGHADEVAEVEKRLGLTLPPSVREFVAFAHDTGEFRDGHHRWEGYRCSFEPLPEVEAICLLEMTAGEGLYSVDRSELGHPNPPIRRYDDLWDVPPDQVGRLIVPSRRANYWATLTEFVFDRIVPLGTSETSFSIEIGDMSLVLNTLRSDFPYVTPARAGIVYFESEQFFVEVIQTSHESCRLSASIVNPVTKMQVPNSLQRLISHTTPRPGDEFRDIFAELHSASVR